MKARSALRAGTAEAHGRVDTAFARFDLGSRVGYRRFLPAQAAGFLPVEASLDAAGAATILPDWPERRRRGLLRADSAALDVTAPEPFPPLPIDSGKASLLGAIYVLEGSRLGGALLRRSVEASLPRRFLEARQMAGSWRKLPLSLDRFLTRPNDLEAAVPAVRRVFARFEEGAKAQLEN